MILLRKKGRPRPQKQGETTKGRIDPPTSLQKKPSKRGERWVEVPKLEKKK